MSTSTTYSSHFKFREDFGLYWPDYDQNPVACHQRCRRRVTDVDLMVPHLKGKNPKAVCVQAGGHAGLWPIRLAGFFDVVYTFEAEPVLYQCLLLNCREFDNIVSSPYALGDKAQDVMLLTAPSAGSFRVSDEGSVPAKQVTIDSLLLRECNAIVLDIEGHETHALVGAKETIERFSPVIMVELLPRQRGFLVSWLEGQKYKLVQTIHSDGIFVRA